MTILNQGEFRTVVREEAEKDGYQLVDILSTRSGMEIILDKTGGITVSECGLFNRKITAWLETKGLFYDNFTLDVSSPGLDRELKTDNEIEWAKGKDVKIFLRDPIERAMEVTGILRDFNKDEEKYVIDKKDGTELAILRGNVSRIRLFPQDIKPKQRR
ncbi:MAG: hypothetical protein HQL28_02005 [Candidatus Omnitrophica bacterium]|nr:hypothetical protein [Candidatus Omnitrophota bacterium]